MKTKNLILHLSLIEGIGPSTIQKFFGPQQTTAPEDLYTFGEKDLIHLFGLSPAAAFKVVQGLLSRDLLEKELVLIEKNNLRLMTIVDADYPELLKHIHMPPVVLYWQGKLLAHDENCLAVIGSRKANRYGYDAIDQIVPSLVHQGWVIVSGGALGADSMAYRATVEAGGRTIAVLGAGLLQPYPASNRRLFADILASDGALVSPFPLMMQALPGNFPARNRIISGLSLGCLVVQAAQQSGASITARFALDQGRDVFAVPGPIDDELSAGCHALIQQGAKLVTSALDIVQEYGQGVEAVSEEAMQRTIDEILPSDDHGDYQPKIQTPEHSILRLCSKPCSMDDLAQETSLDLAALTTLLFDLQLEGKIAQNFMGLWERT